jgi:hypothetical protein
MKKDYVYVKVKFVDWAPKDGSAMLVHCELNSPFLGPLKWLLADVNSTVKPIDDLSEYEESDAEDDHVAEEQDLE